MQLRLLVGMIGLGLAVLTAPLVFAASQQVAEAIQHATVAVIRGQQGYPDDLVQHAEEALKHADMAKKETSSPQLDEGIKQLKEALMKARNGSVDEAVEAAQAVIRHLSELQ